MTLGERGPSAGSVTLAVLVILVTTATVVGPVAGSAGSTGSAGSATTESAPRASPNAGSVQAAPVQAAQQNNSTDASNGTTDNANETTDAANGTTVYHQNPDEVGDGMSEAEVWLASEMADRLSRSVELSQGQRQRAQQLVSNDSEYADLAQQYAAATNEGDDAQMSAFSNVGAAQRDLLATVGTYRTVHQRYREVRRGDNRTRERRLAHELGRLERDVNRSAERLLELYGNLSANSSVDLQNTPERIRNLSANISRTQQRVREQTLVGTRLQVDPVRTNGSFVDPLRFEVRLTTADGDPLADRDVTMEVDNESVEAATDGDGRFTLDYRPAEARTGAGPRTIRYQPANASMYASSSETVTFDVKQVEPNVTVTDRPDRVGYGDRFVVEGRVGRDGVGAAVPLNVSVGDVKLTTAESAENGSFRAVAELPANVTAGERQLRVDVNLTDRALAGTGTTVPMTVESTPTDLSIAEARQREDTVFVAGRLTTADGAPLENETVELRVGDATVEATTNATGGYSTSVTVPRQIRGESAVEVRAAYEDDESNLAASRANATVSVSTTGSALPVGQTLLRIAGVLGASVVGALLVRRFKPDTWPSFGDDENADEESESDAPDGEAVADASGPAVEAAFDAARDELDAGADDAAVVAAYEAVRARLGASVGDRSEATHWEFYADCRAAGLADERLDRLERLTAHYERAAFAAETVPREVADEAVELASSFRPDGGESEAADESGRAEATGETGGGREADEPGSTGTTDDTDGTDGLAASET